MRLIYYTYSYPYGLGERWKYNELLIFKKYFEEIVVVPFTFNNNYNACEIIPDIIYHKPLFDKFVYPNKFHLVKKVLSSKFIIKFIKEFLLNKVYTRKQWVISFLLAAYKINEIIKHPTIKNILINTEINDVHYFFWAREISEIIPFTKKKLKVACRFHGYDLYTERNNGYIPFQLAQMKKCDLLLPCSDHGYKYIKKKYPKANIFIARLGAISEGLSKASDDNILRILSTSMLEPVKRVHIIAKSIEYMKEKVIWYHIGDGVMMNEIQEIIKKINNPLVKVYLLGKMKSTDILSYYTKNQIDLFLNVSSSEGVPVAIMEVLSAGIPVYATDVGGTSEIIDTEVGLLLDPEITPEQLAKLIEDYFNKPNTIKLRLRKNAYERYEQICNAATNAQLLCKKLIEL